MKIAQRSRDFLVLSISLCVVALTPINTDIRPSHMVVMASMLSLAVAVPYLYYRRHKPQLITFPFAPEVLLQKQKLLLVLLAAVLSYLLLPFYFSSTQSHLNWPDAVGPTEVLLLFIGTNLLGLWDELFFINSTLTILRKHFSFWVANAIQASFFTFFLYELGFTSWFPLVIYPFALLQGYMFRTYKSLAFVIAIHLTIDFILFLALLNAYGTLPIDIFVTD